MGQAKSHDQRCVHENDEDIVTEMEPRQAVLYVQKFNRDLSMLQLHMKRTCRLVEQNIMNRYQPWDMFNASFPYLPWEKN